MTTDLSNYNNVGYYPGNRFKRLAWYIVNNLFFKNGWFPFSAFKCSLLRLFGAKVGIGIVLKPHVNIKYPWFLKIGNHTWIGEKVWIDNVGSVTIGDHVCLSQGVSLIGGNHDFSSKSFDLIVKPIVIEDGVWLGALSIVIGGSTCHSHAVLSAGSTFSGKMEAYGIYRGNPAVKVKDRKID